MHDTLSTEYGAYEPDPTFPYRPRPQDRKRSPDLQCNIRELIERLRSFRAILRVKAAVAQFIPVIPVSVLVASSVAAQTVSRSPSVGRIANFVTEASTRFAVPVLWIRAIIQIESAGDEHAISPRGAMGLMQVMLRIWAELSARYGLGTDPFDPRHNMLAGTAYLRELHDRVGSAGCLAAYHTGPALYEQHLATGQPLPPETVSYVAAVTSLLDEQRKPTTSLVGRTVRSRETPLFIEGAGAR